MLVILVAAQVAAGLVLVAGVSKIRHPDVARRALLLPGGGSLPRWVIRGLGSGEVALGAVVLLAGGPVAFSALGLLYAGFLMVSVRQLRAGRSCACLGADTGTVGPAHLAVDSAGAVAAGLAAVAIPWPVLELVPRGLAGVVSLLLLGLAVWLAVLVLGALAELRAARQPLDAGATL